MKMTSSRFTVVGLCLIGLSMACAEGYRKPDNGGTDEMPPNMQVDAGSTGGTTPDASSNQNMADANSPPPPSGACELPYLCAESVDECNDFWEGDVVPNIACDPAEGAVCCNPFSSESPSGGEADAGMPPEPPSGTPMTRDDFCLLILECVMPEGSTVGDCHSVYDDSYCNNWDSYLTCMNSCTSIDCAADEFGTEFVVCEYDCYDDYCG